MFAFTTMLKLKITLKLAYILHLEQFVKKFNCLSKVGNFQFLVKLSYSKTIKINVNVILAKIKSKTGVCDKSNR